LVLEITRDIEDISAYLSSDPSRPSLGEPPEQVLGFFVSLFLCFFVLNIQISRFIQDEENGMRNAALTDLSSQRVILIGPSLKDSFFAWHISF